MARQFRKRSDLHVVILPGAGRLRDGQILTGDEYARFVPHLLEEVAAAVEIPAVPAIVPVAESPVAPAPVVEVAPVMPEAAVEASVLVESDVETPAEDELEESDVDSDEVVDESAAEPVSPSQPPAPRKRGRPRKVPV